MVFLVTRGRRRSWRLLADAVVNVSFAWRGRLVDSGRDVGKVGEHTVDPGIAQPFELPFNATLVAGRQVLFLRAYRPGVHQEAGGVRALHEIGRRQQRAV